MSFNRILLIEILFERIENASKETLMFFIFNK